MTDRITDLIREMAGLDRRISNMTIMLAEKQARREVIKAELDEHVARTEPRIRSIEIDEGRRPKTGRHCVMCRKDVRDGDHMRHVRLVRAGPLNHVMHPEDETRYDGGRLSLPDGFEDGGVMPIDRHCARRIGTEWSRT